MSIGHSAALGTDFASVGGTFILAAPTAGDRPGFGNKGIWFLDPAQGVASLQLPELPQGWTYEGWVVTDQGPMSTGRFRDPASADSDGAGRAAGLAAAPPVPRSGLREPAPVAARQAGRDLGGTRSG